METENVLWSATLSEFFLIVLKERVKTNEFVRFCYQSINQLIYSFIRQIAQTFSRVLNLIWYYTEKEENFIRRSFLSNTSFNSHKTNFSFSTFDNFSGRKSELAEN